jgi:ribosomal protein S18 acetylase RimI-like enzyme
MPADTTFVIDRASCEDSAAFVASTAGLFAEDGGTRDPHIDVDWPDRHGVEDFAREVDDPGHLYLVARGRDRQVYGHLIGVRRQPQAMRPSARTAVLLSMRVAPEARRQGVGSRLVDAFLDWAREQAVNEVTVTAYASNQTALDCYRSNGFSDFEIVLRAEP